jgi:hypothetical protein
MMSTLQTRVQHPIRFRKARADAKIESLQAAIEKKLGLPSGCVKFVTPNGRQQRRKTTVGRLKKNWDA